MKPISATLGVVGILVACASLAHSQPVDQAQGQRPARQAGYLTPDERPDSRLLLPPPPAAGSAAAARDEAAAQSALALHGSARWTMATNDADLKLPETADTFSCALGVSLTAQPAPRLMALLSRALPDLAYSTFGAKDQYKRPRPFSVNGAPTCTPELNDLLRKDGSYPSGHSAIGWGMALLLAELAPDRTNAILSRGRAFGQSRVVCNVHWLSDVEEGRVVAAATVARLHANSQFNADMAAARRELDRLRKKATQPGGNCAAEATALSGG